MSLPRTAGAVLASAVALFGVSGIARAADAPAAPPSASASVPVRILDVPFVPQSEALCGGAATAMVLRYWAAPQPGAGARGAAGGVRAEDFAGLVVPGEKGIRGDSLVAAVRRRGWSAFPMQAGGADVRDHLARGRPVIALVDVGSAVPHFVVLLAWANGGIILHDPAVGPFRVEREDDFDRAWGATERWALLVLPPQDTTTSRDPSAAAGSGDPVAPAPPPPDTTAFDTPVIPEIAGSGASIEGCDALVREGVRRARSGADAEAAGLFSTAAALCPTSAAPIREMAGLRFRAKDYRAASSLAERAIALDASDSYTWRLLAGSRYLAGDVRGALAAWNRFNEPKADLIRVDGLRRTRYEAVADQVALPAGELLTWHEYRRAQRRLDELPAASEAALRLEPRADGTAQVRAVVVERPLLFDGVVDAAMTAVRTAATNEAVLHAASPLRLGELWTARWRFKKNRPRVLLAMDAPALGGQPGLWHLEGFWERQTYALTDSVDGTLVAREKRRRAEFSFADWISADWRFEIGGAVDRFGVSAPVGADPTLFEVEGAVETRTVDDHIALTASGGTWAGSGEHPFRAGAVLARYGSRNFDSGNWIASAGYSAASAGSPLALWYGAGTGTGRGSLLRAHPLLHQGIVNGLVFGRQLAHANLEHRVFPWDMKPVRIGFAIFADAAKAWHPLIPRSVPWQVDVGAGLRLASLRGRGELRADFGYGLEDGETAFSVGLESR